MEKTIGIFFYNSSSTQKTRSKKKCVQKKITLCSTNKCAQTTTGIFSLIWGFKKIRFFLLPCIQRNYYLRCKKILGFFIIIHLKKKQNSQPWSGTLYISYIQYDKFENVSYCYEHHYEHQSWDSLNIIWKEWMWTDNVKYRRVGWIPSRTNGEEEKS